MRRIIISLIIFSSVVFAQEQTLLGSGPISHGGFGGPVIKFSEVNNQFAVLVGGRGGWIINHTIILGGGGYGLVNEIPGNKSFFGNQMVLNFGYGGFEMEYVMNSDDLIHASLYMLIGAGAVSHRSSWDDDDNLWDDWEVDAEKPDAFFVFEPAANLELNFASFMRLNIGVSYRLINGIEKFGFTNSDFSGPSGNLTLKFGLF